MRRIDLDTCEEILVTITRNKTRSLLTAFGIFWGIFMLVALMGGARGVQDMLSRNFAGFATNSGFIATSPTGKPYKGFQSGRWWSLENRDVARLKGQVQGIDIVAPILSLWNNSVIHADKKTNCVLKGLYPIYAQVENPEISMGRYINDMDVRDRRKVCVIGKRIYDSLFPGKGNPCGKFVQIDGIYYRVVGVSLSEGNMSINGSADQAVVIPFSTMQENYNFGKAVHLICYTARKGYDIAHVEKEVAQVVKKAHLIHPDDKQALIQVNAQAMFNMMDSLFSGIRILGWMVGLGTLLAGAIGVSNIMMVTVKERTTEIGIRRAIGARPDDILQQILLESMVLTIIAGMMGISFAVFLLNAAETGFSAHFQISFGSAIGACAILLILGLLAGLAPAYRAMSVKPIDAIRDE